MSRQRSRRTKTPKIPTTLTPRSRSWIDVAWTPRSPLASNWVFKLMRWRRDLDAAEALRAVEQDLGEPVTPEARQRLFEAWVEALRRRGNAALADQLLSAHSQLQEAALTALTTMERLLAESATRTEAARLEVLEAAQDAVDDAAEDFERIAAETVAFLDGKGGAR